MYIEKYNLTIEIDKVESATGTPIYGSFNSETNTIKLNTNLDIKQQQETIAHELGHFFYQYELDNHNDRLERRFNTDDMADLGSKISEMVAHIIGHYIAEIERLTLKICKYYCIEMQTLSINMLRKEA